jgi:hypothetical protein
MPLKLRTLGKIDHLVFVESGMSEDARCCGSGTCIIDAEGRCWCGQQWDGEKMSAAPLSVGHVSAPAQPAASASAVAPRDADEPSA